MCPIGARHIAIQGIGKIARKLGVDFAEAVVRFRFYLESFRFFFGVRLFLIRGPCRLGLNSSSNDPCLWLMV